VAAWPSYLQAVHHNGKAGERKATHFKVARKKTERMEGARVPIYTYIYTHNDQLPPSRPHLLKSSPLLYTNIPKGYEFPSGLIHS
jgi:hypothetical protein